MRWRIVAIIAAVFIVASGTGAAGTVVLRPVTEQLVEGHTVFTVVEPTRPIGEEDEEYAAAVAVLVRETTATVNANRFAGVLWFNDQYLVAPTGDPGTPQYRERFPCTGAVIAVPQGAPDPRRGAENFTQDRYVESYYITDPNDNAWTIDKWNFDGNLVWTVALNGQDSGYSTPDDGTCESPPTTGPKNDEICKTHTTLVDDCIRQPVAQYPGKFASDPGSHGYNYPCGSGTQDCSTLKYNALLYFFIEDLTTVAGTPKDHTPGSADSTSDVAGCHYGTYTGWASGGNNYWCPGNDDAREGNSHPYNPRAPEPFQRNVKAPHGGSANCDTDAENDEDCHATANIDIYYDVAALPLRTNFREYDVEGHTAPYHCHEGQAGFAGQPYC